MTILLPVWEIEGEGGEVESLTPHISPVGGAGVPKFFFGGRP